jgi:hypothetical protein
MCWLEVASFWRLGISIGAFFTGTAFEAVLRWMTWIHVTGCDLIALGTGKGDGLRVNSSGMRSDYEGFAGHDG